MRKPINLVIILIGFVLMISTLSSNFVLFVSNLFDVNAIDMKLNIFLLDTA